MGGGAWAGTFIIWSGAFSSCYWLATAGCWTWGGHTRRFPSFFSRLMSVSYGVGAALTLDEFAIWLDLDPDAYWARNGRLSIDAIILFGSLLAVGAWGRALYRSSRGAAPAVGQAHSIQ